MAILGNNVTPDGGFGSGAGRKWSSPFVLASAQTLTELHAYVETGTGNTYTIHVYTDSGGVPNTRVAYTSAIVKTGSGSSVVEISETGFSVSLAAATYWLGVSMSLAQGVMSHKSGAGSAKAILSGTTVSPPSDPFGTTDFSSGAAACSVWAVVGAAPSTFVPQIVIL